MGSPEAPAKSTNKIPILAKRDHIESLASVRPITAIAELIWNGLDANSDKIQVHFTNTNMQGLDEIRVRDYGQGIPYSKVETLFGNLGESWKKEKRQINGRVMHGKNGKGRFKAFALGATVQWNTTFSEKGTVYAYRIWGNILTLESFQYSDPVEVKETSTGTEVIVTNIKSNFGSLTEEAASQEIARLFAVYMSQYPQISIEYDGVFIDPTAVRDNFADYDLGEVELVGGLRVPTTVSIIEWTIPAKRAIYLCDMAGVSLHDLEVRQRVRAPGFYFTAYIRCDHFRELDKSSNLIIEDLHPEVNAILKPAVERIRRHFRQRLADKQGQIVERWKQEKIYPYEDKDSLNSVEEAERQVFDILAVNVESYLTSFEDADTKSRRFTFRLLAEAVRENPESVQEIIGEVLGLKKEEQDDLAELLRKTPLSSIISSAKTVANRLDFLVGLENLLFEPENKKRLLERDQLHKILEQEAWIFDEDFALAGSELWLEEVLLKHIEILGDREDDDSVVTMSDGKRGRVDLMLTKAIQPRNGEYDYLIVELKRPSQKINDSIVTKIKKYARAVAGDERLRGVKARWTFIAVSNELDDFAKSEANQAHLPRGQISNDAGSNTTIWLKEWTEVISDARSRLQFFKKQLSYEANQDSAREYLKKTHAKFIPEQDMVDDDAKAD